eukprot:12375351-Alexandrium_andersonii.AAC.1
MNCPRPGLRRRRSLSDARDGLGRAGVRTLGPGPPRPRGRPKVLELLATPSLGERMPRNRPNFTHLRRAHGHDVRG